MLGVFTCFAVSFILTAVIVNFFDANDCRIKFPRRILSLIVVNVFLISFFYILFKGVGGYFTNSDPESFINKAYLYRGVELFLALVASIYISFFKENAIQALFKFFGYLGYCFFILFICNLFFQYQSYLSFKSENFIDFSGGSDRQVVWIVFDEFDPEIAFNEELHFGDLNNFNKIRESSVLNTKMFPPARDTLTSVPASLMGKIVTERKKITSDGRLLFLDENGQEFEFKNEGSIFDALNKAGYDGSIFGFYHPYCKIFKATDCSFYSAGPLFWFDPITRFFSKVMINLFPTQSYVHPKWTGDILSQQVVDIKFYIQQKKHNLLYIHLMAPHLPARYAQYFYNIKAANDREAYSLNLKIADKILGDILESLPKDGRDRLLILDSDHWLRSRPGNHPHPSLSMVKVLSDKKSFINYQPTSRIYTPDLVMNFLDGKINSNSDILSFYSNKKYHGTYMPTE